MEKPSKPLEISGVHGNRIHKLDVPVGNLTVAYVATIVGRTDPAPVPEYDLSMYLRPSRYAEADKFYASPQPNSATTVYAEHRRVAPVARENSRDHEPPGTA